MADKENQLQLRRRRLIVALVVVVLVFQSLMIPLVRWLFPEPHLLAGQVPAWLQALATILAAEWVAWGVFALLITILLGKRFGPSIAFSRLMFGPWLAAMGLAVGLLLFASRNADGGKVVGKYVDRITGSVVGYVHEDDASDRFAMVLMILISVGLTIGGVMAAKSGWRALTAESAMPDGPAGAGGTPDAKATFDFFGGQRRPPPP